MIVFRFLRYSPHILLLGVVLAATLSMLWLVQLKEWLSAPVA